jgi:hypothetical protein
VWGWKNTRGAEEWLEGRKRRKGKCILHRERESKQASKPEHTNNAQTGKSYTAQQAKHENSNSPKQVTSPNSLKYY